MDDAALDMPLFLMHNVLINRTKQDVKRGDGD